MSYLKIEQINKTFGKASALNDISFEINEGEFVCLLGPSGCGKTTLLRIISGLEKQNSGKIILRTKDITNLQPGKRNFGMVFQSYVLFPNMTVAKNIAYGLKNKKVPKAEINKKIDEVLELVNLIEEKNKYPNELSGGQQQRVALARAIALSPSVLLMDEPLSALDAKVREHLRRQIKILHNKLGITTIMVTHDQEEALTMADKIIVMRDAEVMQIGTPEEVYKVPSNKFVADFIGTANFIEKDGLNLIFRPEDLEYSLEFKENYFLCTVSHIEFKGAFYRILLKTKEKVFKSNEILFDIISSEKEKLKLTKDKEIYIKIGNTIKL